jgi:hypothetical protein
MWNPSTPTSLRFLNASKIVGLFFSVAIAGLARSVHPGRRRRSLEEF